VLQENLFDIRKAALFRAQANGVAHSWSSGRLVAAQRFNRNSTELAWPHFIAEE